MTKLEKKEQIIRQVADAIDSFALARVHLRHDIGEAIQKILDEGIYKSITNAAMCVSEGVAKLTGHEYGEKFFRNAYDLYRQFTPEQWAVIKACAVPVTYLTWLGKRSEDERHDVLRAIQKGDNCAPFRVPTRKTRRRHVDHGNPGSPDAPSVQALNQVVIDLTPPLQEDTLVAKFAALQSRLDPDLLLRVLNAGAMQNGQALWKRSC